MALSLQEAYNILDLRKGASADEVVNSYKRLALEWHPDKHNQSDLSFDKFSKINNAFRRLTIADDKEISKPLPKEKMFQIFEDVYIKKTYAANLNGHTIPSSAEKTRIKDDFIAAQLDKEKKNIPLPKKVENKEAATDKDGEKNEANLEEEEEEEERRKAAEKRRAKKKRRKEAKKLEKESIPQLKDETASTQGVATNSQAASLSTENTDSKDVETQEVNPLISQSHRLATRGNELANDENYIAAVERYSEAIKLNREDFRFYGNRSYCFDKLGLFNKALTDAERAIQLKPDWSKNYHRKGRALAGLKKYPEAEALFEKVLEMDKDCEEAKQELQRVRLEQLMDMGFTKLQAETALIQHKSVSAALDALLQTPTTRSGAAAPSPPNDVYVSDDENSSTPACIQQIQPQQIQPQMLVMHRPLLDIKLDPNNPEGLKTLWVGNISKDVEEAALKRLFSPFGTVVGVKKKPETYYAFVEFADKSSAGQAMRALQGERFGAQKLYIRFPGKTGANAHPNNNSLIIKKGVSNPLIPNSATSWVASSSSAPAKLKGPVNGNECYFWRTTGCSYGDNCKFAHIQENKGIDRKPWQATTVEKNTCSLFGLGKMGMDSTWLGYYSYSFGQSYLQCLANYPLVYYRQ